jgi:hypothetical protein
MSNVIAAPKPIPSSPTHCRCGAELEPLRRYAGLCPRCLPAAAPSTLKDPTEQHWQLIATFHRRRAGRARERFVRVRCSCGSEREMSESIYLSRRSRKCARCRIRDFRRAGFNGY